MAITRPTLEEHSFEGKIYSPGTQQTSLALFYNADMLSAVGIEPPRELDKAWTEAKTYRHSGAAAAKTP